MSHSIFPWRCITPLNVSMLFTSECSSLPQFQRPHSLTAREHSKIESYFWYRTILPHSTLPPCRKISQFLHFFIFHTILTDCFWPVNWYQSHRICSIPVIVVRICWSLKVKFSRKLKISLIPLNISFQLKYSVMEIIIVNELTTSAHRRSIAWEYEFIDLPTGYLLRK